MDRLPVSANKSNLLRLREELEFAREGLDLLDEKKEVLMAHINTLASKASRVRRQLNTRLGSAYTQLEAALLTHGRPACQRAALAVSMREQIQIKERSFMGVTLPVVRVVLPKMAPSYGFGGTGMAMDAVVREIHQAMETIAELAEIETSLFRLVHEIKKTIRRINALENIHIPTYEATVKYIEESLEEKEREFLFQLKRQKASRKEGLYESV